MWGATYLAAKQLTDEAKAEERRRAEREAVVGEVIEAALPWLKEIEMFPDRMLHPESSLLRDKLRKLLAAY